MIIIILYHECVILGSPLTVDEELLEKLNNQDYVNNSAGIAFINFKSLLLYS